MYSLAVSDHIMIAHSFNGEIFGPAQQLHGATYGVEIELRRAELDANGLVCDIGLALQALRDVLAGLNYKNLDTLPELAGLEERFAPKQSPVPDVKIELPALADYDCLMGVAV